MLEAALPVVNPRTHDQIDGPFDFLAQDSEISGRVSCPRVVPPSDQVERNVLVEFRVVDDVVLIPEVIVCAMGKGFHEPVFVLRDKLERCRGTSQRKTQKL